MIIDVIVGVKSRSQCSTILNSLQQDRKDLELDIIPASLTHTDPEVNLSDDNHEVNLSDADHEVNEEKKKSARKKE